MTGTLRQGSAVGSQPSGLGPLVTDQVRRHTRLDGKLRQVIHPLIVAQRTVKDDTESGARPQHLAVLVLVITHARELDRVVLYRDLQGTARLREGVVNAIAPTQSDGDVGAVASDQPTDD